MSEPKQGTREALKKNESASVDWAEKLKASMNQSSEDPPSVETPEYDDLAALLRAQLNQGCSEIMPNNDDTASAWGDFTDDVDEPQECDEDAESDEADIRAEDELYSEEETEGSFYDEYDECIEFHLESSDVFEESEHGTDELADIQNASNEREPLSEDEENRLSDIEEKSRDYIHPELSIRLLDEEFAEIPSRFFAEKPPSEPSPTPASPRLRSEYRRPDTQAWTDDRLNGEPVLTGFAGNRLLDLAKENQRLIGENEQQFREASQDTREYREDSPTNGQTLSQVSHDGGTSSSSRNHIFSAPRVYAPLQLNLDDISPTARSRMRQQQTREASLAAADERRESEDYTHGMAHKREKESTLGDIELFMDLGYVDVLRRTDEQSRVEQLRVEADKRRRRPTCETTVMSSDEEYGGREDTTRVEECYARARRGNKARLAIAAMGALVGLFYDLIPLILSLFGVGLDEWLGTSLSDLSLTGDPYYAPIGLVWTLLICLPFLARLTRGIRSLVNFEPNRYAVAALALLVTLIGGGIACFVMDPYELPLFCGAALLILTISALAELLVTEGEYRSFSVVSSGKNAHILSDDPTFSTAVLEERLKDADRAEGGRDRRIFSVMQVERVADYFGRTQRYNPYMGRLNYYLPIALLAAVFCAGLSLALGGELLTDGARVFLTVYLVCLPSFYLVAMTLPLFRANTHLQKKGAAVIGAAAPVDYAVRKGKDPVHLIFSDGDALKALYRKDIFLREDPRSEEYRRIAAVVFRMLNIPLAADPILREERLDHYRIEISERGDQYLRLYLVDTEKENATEIMMGSHNALTRRGVRLPRVGMEKQYKKSEGSHVLYLAFNRNFHLAYGVEYRVGRTFGRTVSALNDLGYEVDLSTYDPMFDPSMDGLTRLRKYSRVEVLHPQNYDAIRKARSGGLVATGRNLDLLYPLHACRAMLSAYRRAGLYTWIFIPVSLAAMVVGICYGFTWLMSSALIVLWQLLGMGVTLWVTLVSTNPLTGRDKGKNASEPQKRRGRENVSDFH